MKEKEFDKMKRRTKKILTELPEGALEAGKKAGKRFGRVFGEFKEFISHGSVTDLAVGVIVGTTFTAIVNSLANDVLMPLLGTLMGGIDLTSLSIVVESPIFDNYSVTISYGRFLQSVVTFLVIAVSVFFLIKMLNAIRRKKDEPEELDDQTKLLTEIRDLLKQISIAENPEHPHTHDTPETVANRDCAPSESEPSD